MNRIDRIDRSVSNLLNIIGEQDKQLKEYRLLINSIMKAGIYMNIDIQGIVNDKLKELDENGTIKAAIEKQLEEMLLKTITSALTDYSLKNKIEKQITDQVSGVVADIGFTAYNSFIANKVKQITEDTCRADIAQKIQKTFDDMLVVKRDNIKLSEIFNQYRDWACEEVDDEEKYNLERFHVKFELDEKYGWYNIELATEKPRDRSYFISSDHAIRFTLHKKHNEPGMGYISSTYLNGANIKDGFRFKHLSDIEALLINLTYNDTPIIIDIEDEDDIDNSYDVDN